MKKILLPLIFLLTASALAISAERPSSHWNNVTVDNEFSVDNNWTPASKTTAYTKGRFGFDNNYLYWCYADNNIRRSAYDNTW